MLERAVKKLEQGERDFSAYPLLGKVAVGLVVGLGNDSDPFYNALNRAIVERAPAQIYAIQSDHGNGATDGANRIRNLSNGGTPATNPSLDNKVVLRAVSYPRTQSE
jgi:hypothetical protein